MIYISQLPYIIRKLLIVPYSDNLKPMNLNQICKWITEICEEEPKRFADFFVQDVYDFLEVEQIDKAKLEISLRNKCGAKFASLKKCTSKKEVKHWLHKVTSYVIIKSDNKILIDDYFYGGTIRKERAYFSL
ncbi:MAG: hypothetical protein A2W05_11505 [Candidatus Schekmanbacteria bacterium RBG_16_38_10]|uniref:Uncharacterized protein n=1 Tax=Candidatus Schekmanbacteria bacterium RBG_16_38_10 TaxID=1817879 RepID=A0A1F7S239_9BACT|nr:MAG: hypothetical protein A2W05_11505 [Candidatus Schekmanbacteria bacterium RBG_16_38_10]